MVQNSSIVSSRAFMAVGVAHIYKLPARIKNRQQKIK